MFVSSKVLIAISLGLTGIVGLTNEPTVKDVTAVCRGDGNYQVKKVTDEFGRVTYLNQNNESFELPDWCKIEE